MSKLGVNRQKQRRHRQRTIYPTLAVGHVATIERKECGKQRTPWAKGGEVTTNGTFEFKRELPKLRTRSRYQPHVGNKEAARETVA